MCDKNRATFMLDIDARERRRQREIKGLHSHDVYSWGSPNSLKGYHGSPTKYLLLCKQRLHDSFSGERGSDHPKFFADILFPWLKGKNRSPTAPVDVAESPWSIPRAFCAGWSNYREGRREGGRGVRNGERDGSISRSRSLLSPF